MDAQIGRQTFHIWGLNSKARYKVHICLPIIATNDAHSLDWSKNRFKQECVPAGSLLAFTAKYAVPNNQWTWLCQALLEVSVTTIALWICVCVDDWAAELAVKASNGIPTVGRTYIDLSRGGVEVGDSGSQHGQRGQGGEWVLSEHPPSPTRGAPSDHAPLVLLGTMTRYPPPVIRHPLSDQAPTPHPPPASDQTSPLPRPRDQIPALTRHAHWWGTYPTP